MELRRADIDALQSEKALKEEAAAEVRRRKHDPRQVEALTSVGGSLDQESLTEELKALSLHAKSYEKDWYKSDAPAYPDKKSAKVLEDRLGELEHRGTVKVGLYYSAVVGVSFADLPSQITDARVYSLCFHPDPTKDIVSPFTAEAHRQTSL